MASQRIYNDAYYISGMIHLLVQNSSSSSDPCIFSFGHFIISILVAMYLGRCHLCTVQLNSGRKMKWPLMEFYLTWRCFYVSFFNCLGKVFNAVGILTHATTRSTVAVYVIDEKGVWEHLAADVGNGIGYNPTGGKVP